MGKGDAVSGERIYVIPLRGCLKVPRGRRAERAVNEIRGFLLKNTKASGIRISEKLNEAMWKGGYSRPPSRIRVKVKIEGEVVKAMLPDEIETKKEEKKGRAGSLKERVMSLGKGGSGSAKPDKPDETPEKAVTGDKQPG